LLAIALEGKILSAPRVNSRIGAHGMISGGPGGFTQQETDYLVSTLNAGTLPAKIGSEPVSEDYLTMTLGLSPATRRMLRISAIALAILAGLLWCARLLHRRLYPTVADQQAALRSLGMFEEP
jgi:SecD/SecF fusion protein